MTQIGNFELSWKSRPEREFFSPLITVNNSSLLLQFLFNPKNFVEIFAITENNERVGALITRSVVNVAMWGWNSFKSNVRTQSSPLKQTYEYHVHNLPNTEVRATENHGKNYTKIRPLLVHHVLHICLFWQFAAHVSVSLILWNHKASIKNKNFSLQSDRKPCKPAYKRTILSEDIRFPLLLGDLRGKNFKIA